MKTSEVLHLAADAIEKRGWRAGGWGGGAAWSAPLCLEGGILAALGSGFGDANLDALWSCPSYVAVMDYLDRDTMFSGDREGPEYPLWEWNDTKGRTQAEVIEVLRATAVIEEAKECAVELVTA